MKVAVVGNGPSAKGKGSEIDACDFVVRIKAWWIHGEEDAGEKIDALVWYGGYRRGWEQDRPLFQCEHWFSHCPRQMASHDKAKRILHEETFWRYSAGQPIIALTNAQWDRLVERRSSFHPSTGMVAAFMVIERFPKCELHLFGFDSTTKHKPNFFDARNPDLTAGDPHHQLSEKQMFRRIITHRTWLGEPTAVTLVWHNMPRLD